MRAFLFCSALVLAASAVEAKVPLFKATCGAGIEVHADAGGPVYINGGSKHMEATTSPRGASCSTHSSAKEAKLTPVGAAYQAKLGDDSIDFFVNPDGSVTASWTGKHGANGICMVAE